MLAAGVTDAFAAGHSLRFNGAGAGDVDRVKIRIDDPATALPGPPADVGAGDFTLELWLMASAAANTAPPVACGANTAWTAGNVVVDRDRQGADRKFGLSIAGGNVVFGVSGDATGNLTLCSLSSVLDSARGITWPCNAGAVTASCGSTSTATSRHRRPAPAATSRIPMRRCLANANDPFLVLGAEKFDAGLAYSGWLDELRISTKLRYTENFPRPRAPFVADRFTAALYHFDDGIGATPPRRRRRNGRPERRPDQARRRRQRSRLDAGKPVQRRRTRQ